MEQVRASKISLQASVIMIIVLLNCPTGIINCAGVIASLRPNGGWEAQTTSAIVDGVAKLRVESIMVESMMDHRWSSTLVRLRVFTVRLRVEAATLDH